MIITRDILESGKSSNNGWNKKQLDVFGERDQKKGWFNRIIGKEVTQEQIDLFLSLKDYHLRNHLAKKEVTGKRFIKIRRPIFLY